MLIVVLIRGFLQWFFSVIGNFHSISLWLQKLLVFFNIWNVIIDANIAGCRIYGADLINVEKLNCLIWVGFVFDRVLLKYGLYLLLLFGEANNVHFFVLTLEFVTDLFNIVHGVVGLAINIFEFVLHDYCSSSLISV